MLSRGTSLAVAALLAAQSVAQVDAHIVAWAKGMYCMFGTPERPDARNNAIPVAPLFNLSREDWWFQHRRGCDRAPPPEGEFLELPAGGSFTVEMAGNLAFTSHSLHPAPLAEFGDGHNHSDIVPFDVAHGALSTTSGCIGSPNLHAISEAHAAGSAFAISYNARLEDVTMDNLVVFTVRKNTPFRRLATFDVPRDLPACPEGGCHCAWLWVANGCGQDNMYMAAYRCNVTGSISTRRVASAQTPVYCRDDSSLCVKGAKSMIVHGQAEGNNIAGRQRPLYNEVLGFADGAQNDIFEAAVAIAGPQEQGQGQIVAGAQAVAGGIKERSVSSAAVRPADLAVMSAPRAQRADRRFVLLQPPA